MPPVEGDETENEVTETEAKAPNELKVEKDTEIETNIEELKGRKTELWLSVLIA